MGKGSAIAHSTRLMWGTMAFGKGRSLGVQIIPLASGCPLSKMSQQPQWKALEHFSPEMVAPAGSAPHPDAQVETHLNPYLKQQNDSN
ncbi:MAG: hypothetical protein AAFY26_11100 [Cyanobacteria bacterium J06638_22]